MSTINISDIIAKLDESRKKANKENILRYQQGLGELTGARETMRGLYGQAESSIANVGRSALEDVSRGAQQTLAGGTQNLISSGLGNTTIMAGLARGVEEDRRRAAERVEEQQAQMRSSLATQRAGAEMGAGGGIADFIASRNDIGPDAGIYASLIQAASQGQQTSKPMTISAGLGANARAGLDVFGHPLGQYGGSRSLPSSSLSSTSSSGSGSSSSSYRGSQVAYGDKQRQEPYVGGDESLPPVDKSPGKNIMTINGQTFNLNDPAQFEKAVQTARKTSTTSSAGAKLIEEQEQKKRKLEQVKQLRKQYGVSWKYHLKDIV